MLKEKTASPIDNAADHYTEHLCSIRCFNTFLHQEETYFDISYSSFFLFFFFPNKTYCRLTYRLHLGNLNLQEERVTVWVKQSKE